jgi:hypothetical protein
MKNCFILLLIFVMCGCVTVPRGTGLSKAEPINSPINKSAWLSKVAILDSSVNDKNAIEDALTINILEYIQEGQYFKGVNLLPGKVNKNDIVLRFELDSYQQKRSPHPAYFPAAILTATLYIWFGGPIFNDSSVLSGKLIVEGPSNSIIAEVSSQLSEKHAVSFWSPEYYCPSGIEARTQLIKELLHKMIYNIKHKEGGLI